MIYSTMDQAARYLDMLPGIRRILEEAARYSPQDEFGKRVTLEGDGLYMNLAEYDTHEKAEGCMEAHRKYVDVMCMIEGEETIYVKPTALLNHITQAYDESKDALLAEIEEGCCEIRLHPGEFVILFPEDAHAPGCRINGPSHVKKIIGKVRI